MTSRDELIEAGAQALREAFTAYETDVADVGVVVDAVEGLIRADEREIIVALLVKQHDYEHLFLPKRTAYTCCGIGKVLARIDGTDHG